MNKILIASYNAQQSPIRAMHYVNSLTRASIKRLNPRIAKKYEKLYAIALQENGLLPTLNQRIGGSPSLFRLSRNIVRAGNCGVTQRPSNFKSSSTKGDNCSLSTIYLNTTRLTKKTCIPISAGKGFGRQAILTQGPGDDSQIPTIVNVHLTSGNPRKATKELTMLLDAIEKRDAKYGKLGTIIVGDFNLSQFQIKAILRQRHDSRQWTTCKNPPMHASGRNLDNCINNFGATVVKLEDKLYRNDHRQILYSIEQ